MGCANGIARCGAVVALPMLFAGMIAAQNAANWTRKIPASFPSARYSHAMAYDSAHGQVVLFGGQDAAGVFGDTWSWDAANWTRKSPQNSPSARSSHAMAYDSAHSQVVLFGGYDGKTALNDTWVWNGSNWMQKAPQNSPSTRYSPGIAYDAANNQVVLFGGYDAKSANDTWVWDGANWTRKSPQNSPPARYSHAMVYDSAHGQVVLFGGYDGKTALNDTWVWDGSNWTQKAPQNSPSVRSGPGMAYDSARGQTVLFGGAGVLGFASNDTWIWDGTNWTQKSPQNSPLARYSHAMAYDTAHGQVALYGGAGFVFGDTWTWDGGSVVRIPQISTGGIVNNAGYTLGSTASSVAPGSITGIFGINLTDGTSCLPPSCNPAFGNDSKLNTTMAGAQVTVGGTPVPIFYATPAQLGVQIPFELTGSSAQVVVTVAGLSSAGVSVNLTPVAPGIFTYTADGKGAGAITHVDGSAVTTQSPAHPTELVILYATGLGAVGPAVATGALPGGASTTLSAVTLTIGGMDVIPDYAGLSGCCVGLNQVNVRVPGGVKLDDAVPVVLNIGGKASNMATIAVH